MNISYINHAGAEFILNGDDLCFVDPAQLHTWEWEYELTAAMGGQGGRAANFARRPRTFDLEVRLRGRSRQDFLDRINSLHAVTDADNVAGQPGRLYAGQQYLVCYLAVSGGQPAHPRLSAFATRTLTVLAVEPYWCQDTSFDIHPGSGEYAGDGGKKYDLRYAYRYGTGLAGNVIINTHYAPAPAVITVYGPAVNPSISLGGNVYGVAVSLASGQRLVIDQPRREIYTLDGVGTRVNAFDLRDKDHDIFAPVPVGENALVYSGDYPLNITLIHRRSELLWTE